MATKDICTVDQIDNSTDTTNVIIDESGNLRKVNLKKAVNNFIPPPEKIEQIQQNTNDIAWMRGDISDLKTQVSSLSDENAELKGDLVDLYGVFNVPDNNILEISSENFGKQSAFNVGVVYTDNGINISNNTNGYFWYIFDTEVGKEYEVNFDVNSDVEETNFNSRVNENYTYPGTPDQPGSNTIVSLTKNGTHYSATFTATSDHCMLVFFIRYRVKSLSIINISCIDLSINTTPSIKGTSLPKASNDSLGGIKIGDGLAINEDGILSTIDNLSPIHCNSTSFDVFNRCLCIGDSLTHGIFNHNETGTDEQVLIQKYSYPSQLKKISGVDTTNLGQGGV